MTLATPVRRRFIPEGPFVLVNRRNEIEYGPFVEHKHAEKCRQKVGRVSTFSEACPDPLEIRAL